MIFDTQIVSYAMKGHWTGTLEGGSIVSIVANEFLLVQSDQPTQANYYVPHPSRLSHGGMAPGGVMGGGLASISRLSRPFHRRWTDSMIMDFKNQHPTLVEYGNFAVSHVINDKITSLYSAAVNTLPKPQRKLLVDRFRFLIDQNISCIPVQKEDVETAFGLLASFKEHHNLKANFRNSWNDLLILAATVNRGEILDTEDSELSRFVAAYFGIRIEEHKQSLRLAFPDEGLSKERRKSSSKGYVNNGWAVRFRNLGNSAYRSG